MAATDTPDDTPEDRSGDRSGDPPEIEARSADRIVVFSDAVVAIAITLLALDLPIPDLGSKAGNGDVLAFLRHHWTAYFAFFISFIVIGSHWGSHRAIFRYVNKMTDHVIGVNMSWLLMMILTPFAARTLAASGGFGVRFTIYAGIQAIASICLVRMSRAVAHEHLLRPDAPESALHPDNRVRYATIASFLISIPIAFVTPWAYAIWSLSPAVAARYLRNRPPAPEPPGLGIRDRIVR
jgi:uncharacterized membrane protein